MRLESVTAHAFGPFINRTLRFGEGLTLVYGLNETGKSSWHAAIYAAICGLRRGRGASTIEDRAFRERHRPWDSSGWEVSAMILLEDGRRIEIRQDLDGRVDCRATDAVLGRDCSSEIMYDGAPDGSRWLDLNRRSFLATACVQQADLLAVPENPVLLQEHLQRAAATSGTDATAAEAIKHIVEFQSSQVGPDRVNSPKPLRQALNRLQRAEVVLEQARADHACYLELLKCADEFALAEVQAAHRVLLAEAARADADAVSCERHLVRAQQLTARFPEGPPPPAVQDDVLAQTVATALNSWEQRPEVPDLVGRTASELRHDLAELPTMPSGDLEPHITVVTAREALRDAQHALDLHQQEPPVRLASPHTGGASEDELRNLAHELATPKPEVDPALATRLERSRRRVAELSEKRASKAVVVLSGAAVAIGVLALAIGLNIPGVVLLLAGGVGLAWHLYRANNGARLRALEELHEAENALGGRQHALHETVRRRDAAYARIKELGLPADPKALYQLASAVGVALQAAQGAERWAAQETLLISRRDAARRELTDALRGRGVEVSPQVMDDFQGYEAQCQVRASQARQAALHSSIQAQLTQRETLEAAVVQAAARRQSSEMQLRDVGARLGLVQLTDDALIEGLRKWQGDRGASLARQDTTQREWAELQNLLDGRTLNDLAQEVIHQRSSADRLAADAGSDAFAGMRGDPELIASLQQFRAEYQEAVASASEARGKVAERGAHLLSVPDAEEELAAARAELDRIGRLDKTLTQTRQFLEDAQQRIHRDIAPVLAGAVRRWLPQVTAGRYRDVRVDPQSLKVHVLGPDSRWRDAGLLSRGTAEQIYLLLRVALAEHLTRSGEVCPLILDDVTVQCDSERTEAVMRALHAISQERQVIVFSQESAVLSWVETNLNKSRDSLVVLNRADASPVVAESLPDVGLRLSVGAER